MSKKGRVIFILILDIHLVHQSRVKHMVEIITRLLDSLDGTCIFV